MLTISDAFKAGHMRLRREPWNPFAHIELIRAGDGHAIWVKLHDVTQMVESTEPQQVPLMPPYDDGTAVWEPWTPTDEIKKLQPGVDWAYYEKDI